MKNIELKRLMTLGFKTIGEAGKYKQRVNNNPQQIVDFMKTDKE